MRVVRETWWPPRGTKKRSQRIIAIEFKHSERVFKEQMLAQDLIDDHPGQVMVESNVFYKEVLANWRQTHSVPENPIRALETRRLRLARASN